MKYLFISDIHGCLPSVERALAFFEEQHCDMLCVLGDILNYGPRNTLPQGLDAPGVARLLNEKAEKIVAIRGNCDSEVDQMLLHFPMMSDYLLLVDNGKKLLLTHGHVYGPTHLPPGTFDAVFSGHTHLWELSRMEGQPLVCNTGSITFPKGGNVATFATYENGTVSVHDMEGRVLKQMQL